MAAPDTLPTLRDPAEIARGPRPPVKSRTQSAGNTLDRLMEVFDRVESTRGPMAAELFRSYTEAQFRDQGFPIKIKSSAERQLEAVQTELANSQLNDQIKSNKVKTMVGFLIDNANKPVSLVLEGQAGNETSLQNFFNTTLDASIFERPEDIVAISQKIAEVTGDPEAALNPSDLLLNPFTQKAASKDVATRGAEALAEQTKAQGDITQNQEFLSQIQRGDEENPVVQAFEQTLEAGGEATGQDLTTGLLGDDFDEAQGSAVAVKSILSVADRFEQQGLPKSVVLTGLLTGDIGKRIGSVLSAGETQIDDTGRRILRIDGGVFNDPEAVSNYIALIDTVSQQTGITRQDLLTRMGLPFDDIAEEDIIEARRKIVGGNIPEGE